MLETSAYNPRAELTSYGLRRRHPTISLSEDISLEEPLVPKAEAFDTLATMKPDQAIRTMPATAEPSHNTDAASPRLQQRRILASALVRAPKAQAYSSHTLREAVGWYDRDTLDLLHSSETDESSTNEAAAVHSLYRLEVRLGIVQSRQHRIAEIRLSDFNPRKTKALTGQEDLKAVADFNKIMMDECNSELDRVVCKLFDKYDRYFYAEDKYMRPKDIIINKALFPVFDLPTIPTDAKTPSRSLESLPTSPPMKSDCPPSSGEEQSTHDSPVCETVGLVEREDRSS